MTSSFTIEHMAEKLGGHRAGSAWQLCCPAHDDRTPSLSVRFSDDGTLLVHCHAGCDQSTVISSLRQLGLWPDRQGVARSERLPLQLRSDPHDRKRIAAALKLWMRSMPAAGTPVERYLAHRGIYGISAKRIRFLPDAAHPTGTIHPAMIALVTQGSDDRPSGIHRTFLASDGAAKASVKPNKMMLGLCRGGAVRLGSVSMPLLVGEGVETVLSAVQSTGLSGWAALSTSGLKTLPLPRKAMEIVLLVDGDDAGRKAALHAARRWTSEGHRVRLAQAPLGQDFNDLLCASPVARR
jgi:hypothetical protein